MKKFSMVMIVVLLAYVLLAPGMLRVGAYWSLALFTAAVAIAVVKNNKILDQTPMKYRYAISISLVVAALLLL